MRDDKMNREIFIPTQLDNRMGEVEWLMGVFDDEYPQSADDYVLVDEINGEIIIKAFDGVQVDSLCKKDGITPRDYCMYEMRKQNGAYTAE
jgi:hypothetical protein